jgi:uncharacterized protein (DUF433 family)
MNWQEYIVSDNGVLMGEPTIKGTRLSVEHLMGLKAQGWTEEQVFQNYTRLNKESLQAVFAHVFECMQDVYLVPGLKNYSPSEPGLIVDKLFKEYNLETDRTLTVFYGLMVRQRKF